MQIVDGKIISIAEDELYGLYLSRGMDDCMDFHEYVWRMEKAGCKVTKAGCCDK